MLYNYWLYTCLRLYSTNSISNSSRTVFARSHFFPLFMFPFPYFIRHSSFHSKISADLLDSSIASLLKETQSKKRGFVQTIELQFGLKNYDPNKEKRFNASVVLPNIPRTKYKVCVIGTETAVEEAKAAGVDGISLADVALLVNKDVARKKEGKKPNEVKKFAQSYHAFLASASIIRQVARHVGSALTKAGKFPAPINTSDVVAKKILDQQATVKFQLKSKKSLCLAVAVANVDQTPAQIKENIILAINFFVSLLPKNWQQVKRIHLHATMGSPYKIFGM